MTEFTRVGLVVKVGDESVTQTLSDVVTCLEGLGIDPVFDASTENLIPGKNTISTKELGKTCELAIVIGGDGTLLHAARALVGTNTALVGVNRGRLGFLVDVPHNEGLEELVGILQGQYISEERILLDTRILRDGECINSSPAFNDTVIRVHDVLQIMDFDIIIDDVLVTHQRADGVIIATPSGSTAYSLSNGGPIVGPTIEAVVLQPICPHTLTSRPLMIDSKSNIRVHLWDDQVYQAQVVCDGQVYMDATLGDMIELTVSDERIQLLHPATYDYHRILREKLNWG